jgi:hypothetical protein
MLDISDAKTGQWLDCLNSGHTHYSALLNSALLKQAFAAIPQPAPSPD